MAVYLSTGTPSSGKSYMSISTILDWLCKKKLVIANFELNFTKRDIKRGYDKRFFYIPNKDLTVEKLLMFALEHEMIQKEKEDQCLIVIDEAGGRFNVTQSKKSDIVEWEDFYSQHAKLGFSCLLIAQKDRMINKKILAFVENEYKHRKVNNYGPLKKLPFTIFCRVEYWYQLRSRVRADFILYTKNIARRYNRFKLFDGFRLSEALTKKIQNIQADIGQGYKIPAYVLASRNENDGVIKNTE